MQRVHVAATIAIVFLGSFIGCNGGGGLGPNGTITGKVTLDGKVPPAGILIQFIGNELSTNAELSSNDGSFAIDYVPVGSYQVMLTPVTTSGTGSSENMDPESAMKMASGEDGNSGNPNAFDDQGIIPRKYTDISTSGVSFDVKEGDNEFTLDMKD